MSPGSLIPILAALVVTALAGSSFRNWRATGDRTLGYAFATVASLAVLSLASLSSDLTGRDAPAATLVSAVAFFGSAFAVLMVRHSILPLSKPIRIGFVVAFAAYMGTFIWLGVPVSDVPVGTSGTIMYALGIVLWGACVGEPIVRFWRTARTRPLVQRARLRALATAFGAIIVLLGSLGAIRVDSAAGTVIGNAFYLALCFFLFASFAPPGWMRRLWRLREERGLITAAPLFFVQDRMTLASRALEWAVRLTGADGGWVIDHQDDVLAVRGTVGALAERLPHVSAPRIERIRGRLVALLPLRVQGGTGQLAVVAGPFTPPFGRDELDLLEHYAAATATSLDHLRMNELRGAFLASVSHELRTPLTSMQGIALTLGREDIDALPSENKRDLRARLRSSAGRLERILDDLLDLEHLSDPTLGARRRPTDVAGLTRNAIASTASAVTGRSVSFEPVGPVVANVDPARTTRILEGLLSNARHTPDHTSVWVRLDNMTDGLLITVEDDGPGVPIAQRTKIFEAFAQGPGAPAFAPGVGVGLTIVARQAQLHGGSAWVEDRDGGGAAFKVWLPFADGRARVAAPPVASVRWIEQLSAR